MGTALLLGACGGEPEGPAGWQASVDTVGDTVVIRTTAGMEWPDTMELVPEVEIGVLDGADEYMFGSVGALGVDGRGRIWAVDRQIPEIRVYSSAGEYLMTVGGPGQGPGEIGQPDGGFAILPDGRAVLRDPGNGRLQVWDASGEALETWRHRSGFSTSNPMWMDRDGNVYNQVLMDVEASMDDWSMGLAKVHPDGSSTDTLPVPDAAFEAPFIEARREGSWSRNSVPFTAREHWAFHPDGYFVHGIGDDYSFTLLRDPETHGAMPLRIERAYTPIPVAGGEASEEKLRATRNMRRSFPDWKWNGPDIPDTKPAFQGIHVGRDGRIWVQVSTPGVKGEDPDYDPTDPDAVPNEWNEPTAFDVFEADGRYLGHVRAPDDLSLYPTPVIDGDYVWAVTRDELGVNRVVRFRLQAVGGP